MRIMKYDKYQRMRTLLHQLPKTFTRYNSRLGYKYTSYMYFLVFYYVEAYTSTLNCVFAFD